MDGELWGGAKINFIFQAINVNYYSLDNVPPELGKWLVDNNLLCKRYDHSIDPYFDAHVFHYLNLRFIQINRLVLNNLVSLGKISLPNMRAIELDCEINQFIEDHYDEIVLSENTRALIRRFSSIFQGLTEAEVLEAFDFLRYMKRVHDGADTFFTKKKKMVEEYFTNNIVEVVSGGKNLKLADCTLLTGNGFNYGPHSSDGTLNVNYSGGLGWDFMTNIIIFGRNPFHVDSIGHWLGGHEPGNMGYLHLALERGVSKQIDPSRIPVYEWFPNGSAVLTPLSAFTRTPLLTYYLRRDYSGSAEPYWHMMDEPFDYTSVRTGVGHAASSPGSFILRQNTPNPFNPSTSIEFHLPANGYARLEIYNGQGQLVDVLVDGYLHKGDHLAVWNTHTVSSGPYFYRFHSGGFTQTRKMLLLK